MTAWPIMTPGRAPATDSPRIDRADGRLVGRAPRRSGKKYPYDPATARRLLQEAEDPNGFEVELWVPESGSGMQAPVGMATVIQANLAGVGVKANLKTMEWDSYLGKLRTEAPTMFALSWFLKSDDPDLSTYPLFFSARLEFFKGRGCLAAAHRGPAPASGWYDRNVKRPGDV